MTKTPDAQLLDNHCCHFEQKGEMRNAIKGDWGGGEGIQNSITKEQNQKQSHNAVWKTHDAICGHHDGR